MHRGFKDPSQITGNEEEKFVAFKMTMKEIFLWLKEILGKPKPEKIF